MTKKPSNREFKDIFDGIAENYDAVSNAYTLRRRSEGLIQWVEGNILEVGAGTGNVSSFLYERSHVTLSDISPQMCKIAQQKLGCKVVCCDAERLPFGDNSFDTIIASEVIYYLDSPVNFMKEAYRILKPGGYLLISAANHCVVKFYNTIRNILRVMGIPRMYFDDRNRKFSKLENIIEMLDKNKFLVEEKRRIIILPFSFFDPLNRFLEKLPFVGYFGMFIIIRAISNKDK